MKKLLLAFMLLLGLAAPAVAQNTIFFLGDDTMTCNASGGGAACNVNAGWAGRYAQAYSHGTEYGFAVDGADIAGLTSQVTAAIAAKPGTGTTIAIVGVGPNDLWSGTYASAQAYYDALIVQTDRLKAAGINVGIVTIPPISGTNAATHNSRRLTVNALIRAANADKFYGIIDADAIKFVGEDNAPANATYYAGAIKLTNTGSDLVVTHAKHVIQQMLGIGWDHADWQDGSIPAIDFTVAATVGANQTVPADAYEMAEARIKGFTRSLWIGGATIYVTTDPTVRERKFRITCDVSTAQRIDTIMFYGQKNAGHRHQGFGKFNWNPLSHYGLARGDPKSSCSGGPLNSTIYWEPEMLRQLPNGAIAGMKPRIMSNYYIGGLLSDTQQLTWLRRNFRFIVGANPMNFNDTAMRTMYANAGLVYPGTDETPAGFSGIQCYRGSDGAAVIVSRTASRMLLPGNNNQTVRQEYYARHMVAEDGSDPWGGQCTGSDAQPGYFIFNLSAPQCWDGHNFGSPDGRSHYVHGASNINGGIAWRCPTVVVNGVRQSFVQVPALQVKTEIVHTGFNTGSAPYNSFFLFSDRMNPANTPGDPTSLDPCRQTGPYFCPGSTFHADWWFAWDEDTVNTWQRQCLGISVRGVAPTQGPAECGDSTIAQTEGMAYGTAPEPGLSCTSILQCSIANPGQPGFYNPLPLGSSVPGAVNHTLGGGMAANDNPVNFGEDFGRLAG